MYWYRVLLSLRTADVFPVVPFGGREATTGNTSAVRRLSSPVPIDHSKREKGIFILSWRNEKLQFPVDLPPL